VNVAVDVDGTIDAAPVETQSMCAALKAAGHTVYVITGIEEDFVTQQDVTDKQGYLKSLGFTAYDSIYVCPQPHDTNKAQLIKDLDVSMLFDNDKDNCKAAASECFCWLLWNNKEP
jgi:hypothetical protein